MTSDKKIDPRVFELYDEYCHGYIDRRTFLSGGAGVEPCRRFLSETPRGLSGSAKSSDSH